MRRKYQIVILGGILFLALLIIFLLDYSYKKTSEVFTDQTEITVYDIKKEYLKESVLNVVGEIKVLEDEQKSSFLQSIYERMTLLENSYDRNAETFLIELDESLLNGLNSKVSVYVEEEDEMVFTNDNNNDVVNIADNEEAFSVYEDRKIGPYSIVMGVKTEDMVKKIKGSIRAIIYQAEYSQSAYIWVNEVLDYRGGENYALRRIHPYLAYTEGDYLSTYTKDLMGNTPYQTELDGLMENGEVFYTHYFEELNSANISKKLSYAYLYEPFDWIIAMGVHTNEIDVYADETEKKSMNLLTSMKQGVLYFLLSSVIVLLAIFYIVEKRYYINFRNRTRKELYTDPLTKGWNRRAGQEDLEEWFENYKGTGISPIVYMIDIDNFKHVNDTYGHDIGDQVICETVKALNHVIRNTDRVYRWGGEEFLLVCDGLHVDMIDTFTTVLLNAVRKHDFIVEAVKLKITVSIGVSHFKADDITYHDAVKRADIALYKAKAEGRNQYHYDEQSHK
ncbi:sensor domain-containing diguanylate cyclase [Saliterribacillus persicus]|nr:sensor domain-containing diguanylate cyclase [Saliterribacillus persicus]